MYNFIVNPRARSKQGNNIWKKLKLELDTRGVIYREFLTTGQGHGKKIADKLTQNRDKEVTIIVLGGDGTLNEVVNGINSIDRVTLGYIPIGSSNDFARGMELETDPYKALEIILHPTAYRRVDYGIVTLGSFSRRYVVSAGIGYDAGVCYETNYSSIKTILNKLHIGGLTYGIIGLKQLLNLPLVKADILMDDEKTFEKSKLIFVSTHIQRFEGGGFMFCPHASCVDGKLDVCIANNILKLKVLSIIPKAYTGNHLKYKGINIYRCSKMKIMVDRPLYVHTDGESFIANEEAGNVYLHKEVTFSNSLDKIKCIVG